MNIAVILAAGSSKRFGGTVNKQYIKINGKELFMYSYYELKKSSLIDKILVVVDNKEFQSQYFVNKYSIECVAGGNTRNESISNAIDYIKANYKCDKVLFHDANRPFATADMYNQVINMLDDCEAVATIDYIDDTLVKKNGEYVNREDYMTIQTPEAFNFDYLFKHFDKTSTMTAIVNQMPKDCKLGYYKENKFNFKISHAQDVFIAEQIFRINYCDNTEYNFDINTLKGKNVLIFGGHGGLGNEIVQLLESNHINYCAPTHQDLDLKTITAEDIKGFCKDFKPDVIINTAAVSYSDTDGILAHFDDVININLKANIVMFEYAKSLSKRVNIVCLGSSSSTKGRQNITNYSASKCALNSVVESLADVLAKQNVYINVIIPEKMNTPMIQKLHHSLGNEREMLDPKEVAKVVLKFSTTDKYGELVHLRKGI